MNAWKLLAWFGGRSYGELDDLTADECGTSIAVGTLSVVSACMVAGGQYMFWAHLGHTADAAAWITAAVTPVVVCAYRTIVRALEVVGWIGTCLISVIVAGILGTFAMLAGHEWVILPFQPQIVAQTALDSAKGLTEYGGAVESSLGLPQLREDNSKLVEALGVAQRERNRAPNAVLDLRKQVQGCDRTAAALQARIPLDAEAVGYTSARNAWREQRAGCNAMRAQAEHLFAEHQRHFANQIAGLTAESNNARLKLNKAKTAQEATLKRDAPALISSATAGFARHKALWSAVEAGRVPAWAAYGLMWVVLALEGLCFLLKLTLPPDAATLKRRNDTEQILAFGALKLQICKAFRANIPSVVSSSAEQLAEDMQDDVQSIVIPGLRTEMAARAFKAAHESVAQAQRRTAKASPDLLRQLADLASAIRGARGGPRTAASP